MVTCPDTDWLLNLTGGLKTMSFGLLGLLDRDRVDGIYLERSTGWMRLRHDGHATASTPLGLTTHPRHRACANGGARQRVGDAPRVAGNRSRQHRGMCCQHGPPCAQ